MVPGDHGPLGISRQSAGSGSRCDRAPACRARRGCAKLAPEDTPMEHLDLPPIAHIAGTVRMPGSKSISNRMLLLAALAAGTTELDGLLESDDTKVMLDALLALGIRWHTDDANRYVIEGASGPFPNKHADLFLGLSGLSMRT